MARSGRKSARGSRGFLHELLEDRRLLSTVVVNTVVDQVDPPGSSVVSLRDAIAKANVATTPTSIVFSTSVFATKQTIKLTGSRLIIQTAASTDTVTITAPTAGLIINGNNSTGDFVVWTNTTADLVGLTITGGKSTNGAGVDNYGNVTVTDCTITGNNSPNGGGVYTNGTAFLLDDTVSNNTGTTGGGIWNGNGGYLSLTNTTVANNTGAYGGGIYNGGTLDGTTELHNATISGNTAGFGGGVYNYTGGIVGLGNTIIAQNKRTGTGISGNDVAGAFVSRGYDLIGNADGGTGFVSTDLVGHSTTQLNADLGVLGSNGGPTPTMIPLTGSPALGAGSVPLISYESTDQRGLPRIVNGKVDIGAVETQAPVVTLTAPVAVSPGSSVSPGPVLTTLTPTFTWKPITVAGVTGYQINIYDQTLGKFVSYTVSGAATSSFTIASGVLAAGDSFVWNVRALAGTQSGPPSVYLYFQTPPLVTLPAPAIIGPGSTVSPGPVLTTLTPTFTWHAVTVAGVTGYQINIYDQTLAKSFSYTVTGATATSFTIASGVLAAGDSFVWNVRALAGAQSGPPSVYLYFQTPHPITLPAPVVIGPGSTVSPGPVLTALTPTFTWHAVTGVAFDSYQINLYDETSKVFVSIQVSATATSYTIPAGMLVAGDTYVWNLRLKVGSTTGPESAYLYFTAG